MTYRLDGASISCLASVSNIDSVPMPFQFGFHPGFVWPLPSSAGKKHVVTLGNGGAPGLYRLDADKLLVDDAQPTPFAAGRLVPDRAMFEDDAMLFPTGAGNSFSFSAEGGARIDMKTANLPNFAIWQKPGAPFLCLEPWRGTAPLAGTGDALETRNGTASLSPGEQMDFRMELKFTAI
jgi:galactose mutarotase-like enzyme